MSTKNGPEVVVVTGASAGIGRRRRGQHVGRKWALTRRGWQAPPDRLDGPGLLRLDGAPEKLLGTLGISADGHQIQLPTSLHPVAYGDPARR
jgi:hypothetical protein